MKTILLVPTGEGVGLTSACLGLVYALECQGVKAGFVKPFSQELQAEPDRTTALYRHISKLDTVEPITYAKITQQLNDGETDELLEEAVSYSVKWLNHMTLLLSKVWSRQRVMLLPVI